MEYQEQEEKRQKEGRQKELQKKQTEEELEMEQRRKDYEEWLQARMKRKQQKPDGKKYNFSVLHPVTYVPHQHMVPRPEGIQEGPPSPETWGEPPPVRKGTVLREAGVPRPSRVYFQAEPSIYFDRNEQRHGEGHQRRISPVYINRGGDRRYSGQSDDQGVGASYLYKQLQITSKVTLKYNTKGNPGWLEVSMKNEPRKTSGT